MKTLNLINNSKISNSDFQILMEAVKQYVPLVTKAWKLDSINVTSSTKAGDYNVYLVNTFTDPTMNVSANGYHDYKNNVPSAYIRTYTKFTFGLWYKGLIRNGKLFGMPKATAEGISTSLLHEIAEMLVDPTLQFTAVDPSGRKWIVEICDHSNASFDLPVTIGTVTTDVVAPDFTLPSYYSLKGKGPYSYLNLPTSPFYLGAKSYATYIDIKGTKIPVSNK